VVGGEYAAGTAGLSVCEAAAAGLVSPCLVETEAFILDVARFKGCNRPQRAKGLSFVVAVMFHLRM
jgi:hypothetical protein